MSNEKRAYAAFRENIIGRGDRINRVENPIMPGMFDVSCCLRPGIEFWMEIKSPEEPVKSTTPLFGSNHPVLDTQINWGMSQIQAGGFAYFFIDTDKRRMMISAKWAEEINIRSVIELESMAIWATPKPTPSEAWKSLSEYLRNLDARSRENLSLTK